MRRVEDLTNARDTFDAAVYPSMLVVTRHDSAATSDTTPVAVAMHHRDSIIEWNSDRATLGYDASPGAPWILVPPAARRPFDAIRAVGLSLGASDFGPPRLGVKCGCNAAFLVRVVDRDGDLAAVEDENGKRAWIENGLLRPVLRGDSVAPWHVAHSGDAIIWTHSENGAPLSELPPHAARWFGARRRQLVARTDARRATRWWSLFRTEAARSDRPRVVWCDVGRAPRAAYVAAGDPVVPLNTCYALRCASAADAQALVALLNSPLASAWLNLIAEPARGGYRRYLAWTVALLPLPHPWARARPGLAVFTSRALDGNAPDARELHEAACAAYGMRAADVEPLIAWTTR